MKKITSIVKGVSESVKASFQEKRVMKAYEAAVLNKTEELETAKAQLEEYDAKDKTANKVIEELFNLNVKIEDAERDLATLKKVEEFLNAEVADEKAE